VRAPTGVKNLRIFVISCGFSQIEAICGMAQSYQDFILLPVVGLRSGKDKLLNVSRFIEMVMRYQPDHGRAAARVLIAPRQGRSSIARSECRNCEHQYRLGER
jgi:hypothetical protein